MSLRDHAIEAAAARVILPHLPASRVLAPYLKAAGNEIESGKFTSPESSSALVANAFGLFLDDPELLQLPGLTSEAQAPLQVHLEHNLRFPWSGGRHPWLDVVVETPIQLIGIESKRYEPFRGTKQTKFSEAYWRPVWGSRMQGFEEIRDRLRDGRIAFRRLDVAQLIKHAFGLRTQAKARTAVLLYLYAQPTKYPDGRTVSKESLIEHREEVALFTQLLVQHQDEVRFASLTYEQLLAAWVHSGSSVLTQHAEAVALAFALKVS